MAESLGVSQIYMGFVLVAARRRRGALERLLGLGPERTVSAAMAFGVPAFHFAKMLVRSASPLERI